MHDPSRQENIDTVLTIRRMPKLDEDRSHSPER